MRHDNREKKTWQSTTIEKTRKHETNETFRIIRWNYFDIRHFEYSDARQNNQSKSRTFEWGKQPDWTSLSTKKNNSNDHFALKIILTADTTNGETTKKSTNNLQNILEKCSSASSQVKRTKKKLCKICVGRDKMTCVRVCIKAYDCSARCSIANWVATAVFRHFMHAAGIDFAVVCIDPRGSVQHYVITQYFH